MLQGVVVDAVTKRPIADVAIELYSPTGTLLATLDTTDAGGNFYAAPTWIDDPQTALLLGDTSNSIFFNPIGLPYNGAYYPLSAAVPASIALSPVGGSSSSGGGSSTPSSGSGSSAPAKPAAPAPVSPKISPLAVVGVAAIGLGAYLMLRKPKGRVGDAEGHSEGGGSVDYAKYIIPIGIVGIGYFLVRSVTNTLGLTETDAEKAQREASQNALINTTNQVLATQSPTMSDANLAALADRIFEDLRSPMPLFNTNDADDATAALKSVGNTADVLKLVGFFGSRSQTLFGIPGPAMTLMQFVRTASHGPSAEQIAAVNAAYTAAGINWQW